MNPPARRVLHLNSLLNGGGTDDQCVQLALGLHRLGQHVWLAGPEGREFSKITRAISATCDGVLPMPKTTSGRWAASARRARTWLRPWPARPSR